MGGSEKIATLEYYIGPWRNTRIELKLCTSWGEVADANPLCAVASEQGCHHQHAFALKPARWKGGELASH